MLYLAAGATAQGIEISGEHSLEDKRILTTPFIRPFFAGRRAVVYEPSESVLGDASTISPSESLRIRTFAFAGKPLALIITTSARELRRTACKLQVLSVDRRGFGTVFETALSFASSEATN